MIRNSQPTHPRSILRPPTFLLSLLILVSETQGAPVSHQWKDCSLRFDGKRIEVGNSLILRSWQLGETLVPEKLTDLGTGTEWIVPLGKSEAVDGWSVSHKTLRSHPVEDESLQITLDHGTSGQKYRIRVFPETPAIEVERLSLPEAGPEAEVDRLVLPGTEDLTFTNVTLKDHTDKNLNALVVTKENSFQKEFKTSGNIAFIENGKTGHGLLFMKIAPLPHARAAKTSHDFSWDGTTLLWLGPGFNSISKRGYPCAVICYSGGRAGRIAASLDYQRSLRPYVPGRDGQILSNTWGDRSRDAKISEEFLIREIVAGKKFGIDVMQVDDGWQRGTTKNSAAATAKSGGVWTGWWKADPKFWTPHEQRLPNGLEPVASAARANGVKMGIWYAPDSSEDFTNWERDADRILELYRDHGIRYFKLDSIVMASEIAEHRVLLLMHKVIEKSGGQAVIDLDVTAGIRPGYLGAIAVGTVFVENRYTDWCTYWPHDTLRNFWQLSEFVDPVRLRMEFLNNTRNPEVKQYKGSALAPVTYPPAYLFASVMFSSPLAWFEVSELPEPYSMEVAPLIGIWKEQREAIHQGDIIPIGQVPNGKSWTGLCSIAPDRKSGYAVLFREVNDQESAEFEIPLIETLRDVKVLHGEGKATVENGKLRVKLDQPRRHLFVRF